MQSKYRLSALVGYSLVKASTPLPIVFSAISNKMLATSGISWFNPLLGSSVVCDFGRDAHDRRPFFYRILHRKHPFHATETPAQMESVVPENLDPPLKSRVKSEFNKEPVQTTCSLVSALLALAAFGMACFFSQQESTNVPAQGEIYPLTAFISIRNLLIVFSFSLSSIFAASYGIRLLGRRYPFHAFVLSILVASLVAFFSVLTFSMIPPIQITSESMNTAKTSALYATVIGFIALNGFPIFGIIAEIIDEDESKKKRRSTKQTLSPTGLLFLFVLLCLGWGTIVGKGQTLLVETFIRIPKLTTPSNEGQLKKLPNQNAKSESPSLPASLK